jgi:hypothetical protein
VGVAEVVPSGAVVPTRTGSEVGAVAPTFMHSSRRMGAAVAGWAKPACAATQRSARIAAACGPVLQQRAGGQELHALLFDLPVIIRSNSSPTNLF